MPGNKKARYNSGAQLAAQAQQLQQPPAENEPAMNIQDWCAAFAPATEEELVEITAEQAARGSAAAKRIPPPEMGTLTWKKYCRTAEAMEAFKFDEVNALIFCIAPDLFAVCRKEPILSSKSFPTTAFGPVRAVAPRNTCIWRHHSTKQNLTERNLPSLPWT